MPQTTVPVSDLLSPRILLAASVRMTTCGDDGLREPGYEQA